MKTLMCVARTTDKSQLVTALHLVEDECDRFGDNIRVWKYHRNGQPTAHFYVVWGFKTGHGLANDMALLKSLQVSMAPARILVVDRTLKTHHFAHARIPLSDDDLCLVNQVEDLERLLGLTLAEADRNRIVFRLLPRTYSVERAGPNGQMMAIQFSGTPGERRVPMPRTPQIPVGADARLAFAMYNINGMVEEEDSDYREDEDEIFQERVSQAMAESMGLDAPPNRDAPVQRPAVPFEKVLREPIPLVDGAPKDIACVVCLANARTIAFVDPTGNCQHQVVCDSCARELWHYMRKCPLDNQPFTSVMRPITCMENAPYARWIKKDEKEEPEEKKRKTDE